jgi:hypothetical protein
MRTRTYDSLNSEHSTLTINSIFIPGIYKQKYKFCMDSFPMTSFICNDTDGLPERNDYKEPGQ